MPVKYTRRLKTTAAAETMIIKAFYTRSMPTRSSKGQTLLRIVC
jgi:hypothetical protein